MIIQRINRTGPEKVFVVVRNDSSASIAAGVPGVFKMDGTRDGLDIEDCKTGTAAKNGLIAGLMDVDLAASQYGLCQCYGVRTDAVMLASGSDTDANAEIGDALELHTAASILSGAAAGAISAYLPGIVMGESFASAGGAAGTTTGIVFLRLM